MLADEHPELVARLVIVEAALVQGGGSISPWIAAHGVARFVEHGHGALLERLDGSGTTGSGPPPCTRSSLEHHHSPCTAWPAPWSKPIGRDVGRRLLELHMPWAYVAGGDAGTELTDQDQDMLEEAGADVLRVPHAGHLLPWANPRGLATALGYAMYAACSSRTSGAG